MELLNLATGVVRLAKASVQLAMVVAFFQTCQVFETWQV